MKRSAAVSAVLIAGLVGVLAPGCTDSADVKLESSDRDERVEAVRELGRRRSDAAVERLQKTVHHEDVETAMEAVRALGRMRRPRAVAVLKRVAGEERRPTLRRDAAVELGRQREKTEAAEVLRRVVRTDPDARVRAAAATSLANLGSLADVALLVEVAETDDSVMVQSRAVGAVERLVGLGFRFDSKAPLQQRREALARMRAVSLRAAASLQQTRRQETEGKKGR